MDVSQFIATTIQFDYLDHRDNFVTNYTAARESTPDCLRCDTSGVVHFAAPIIIPNTTINANTAAISGIGLTVSLPPAARLVLQLGHSLLIELQAASQV